MLAIFRKAKKAYSVLITVLLLLPVQQSFSQSLDKMLSVSDTDIVMDMEHCKTIVDSMTNSVAADDDRTAQKTSLNVPTQTDINSQLVEQDSCCDENICDANHCSFSISFVALFNNYQLPNSFEAQQHVVSVEHREIRVIPSELFRPPRIIQS